MSLRNHQKTDSVCTHMGKDFIEAHASSGKEVEWKKWTVDPLMT